MPEGTGQPKEGMTFRDEIHSALNDTWILLKFLGEVNDSRLRGHFADTTGRIVVDTSKDNTPPCRRYNDFLNRLSRIQVEVETDRMVSTDIPIEQVGPPDGGRDNAAPALSDMAFLLWARDFLSSVAAPATAESIQMTKCFLQHRASTSSLRSKLRSLWSEESDKPVPARDRIRMSAAKLASRVTSINGLLLVTTIFTVALSTYALSGHVITAARDSTISEIRTVDEKILAVEQANSSRPPQTAPAAQSAAPPSGQQSRTEGVKFLCDLITVDASQAEKMLEALPEDKFDIQSLRQHYYRSPSFGPIPNQVFFNYSSYSDIDVCRQRRRAQIQLFAIGEQLVAWERVITNRWFFASTFGKSKDVNQEFSKNMGVCLSFTGSRNTGVKGEPIDLATGEDPNVRDQCRVRLGEIAEYYGRMPDAILGCITLYVLPCLYGFLGATITSLRRLRAKVESGTVSFTDRAILLQNGILGIAAGAVIGLFAVYLSKANAAESIGVSALAFLAGYNVTALFSLFDDISNRVFRGGSPAKKPSA